jgi:hypothetical protein
VGRFLAPGRSGTTWASTTAVDFLRPNTGPA